MAKTVKPITGVDRIFYATITEDNGVDFPTYSPWKRLFGAKEFGYVTNTKESAYYQDGQLDSEYNELNYVELTMNVTDVAQEDIVTLFGHTEVNGGYVVKTDDVAENVAIGVRIRLAGGSYRYAIFYKGQLKMGDVSIKNGDDKLEFTTKSLTGKFKAVQGNLVSYWKDAEQDIPEYFTEAPTEPKGE